MLPVYAVLPKIHKTECFSPARTMEPSCPRSPFGRLDVRALRPLVGRLPLDYDLVGNLSPAFLPNLS